MTIFICPHSSIPAVASDFFFLKVEEDDAKIEAQLILTDCHLHFPVQFSSVAQSYMILCDHMDCSMPGLPIHHQLPELTQTHVH